MTLKLKINVHECFPLQINQKYHNNLQLTSIAFYHHNGDSRGEGRARGRAKY